MRILPVLLLSWFGSADAGAAWNYESGLSTAWHQVSESEGGTELVSEEGLRIGIDGRVALDTGSWQLHADGGLYGSSLDYEGVTQLGAPLTTETDWRDWRVGAGAGRTFELGFPLRIGAEVSYQWRKRNIRSTDTTPGLTERYRTIWLGLRGAIQPLASTTFEAGFACAVDSQVEVGFGLDLDPASLSLEDHCRAGLTAALNVGRLGSRTIYVEPFASWEWYPRSAPGDLTANGTAVGKVHLPETRLATLGIAVGLRTRASGR